MRGRVAGVCNGGLILGALAIANDDTTGIAAQILAAAVPNAVAGCEMAATADGTSTETPNYWYFATTAHTHMAAALLCELLRLTSVLPRARLANPDFAFSCNWLDPRLA